MRILKGNFLKRYKSKFGNFKIEPDKGWKISQSYLDYESKLLIVSESDCDEKNWTDTGFGSKTIPSREYIINPKNGEILNHTQWSKYFSYEPVEILSDDGKYKLIIERTYESDRNSDCINERLIEIQTGKIIGNSSRLAFLESKQENLLERLERQKADERERKRKLESMPTLEEYHSLINKEIGNEQVIIYFYSKKNSYELKFTNNTFLLSISNQNFSNTVKLEYMQFVEFKTFSDLDSFWNNFMVKENWITSFLPYNNSNVKTQNSALLLYVVHKGNELRLSQNFSDEEYAKLRNWENAVYSKEIRPSEFKQGCSNCGAHVDFNGRYPRYICSNCTRKTITDENGVELRFSNIGFSGGLRIAYYKGGEKVSEETDKIEKVCYIDGKKFIATEARFGGIVIQRQLSTKHNNVYTK